MCSHVYIVVYDKYSPHKEYADILCVCLICPLVVICVSVEAHGFIFVFNLLFSNILLLQHMRTPRIINNYA